MQIAYALSQRDFFESLIAIRNRKKWTKWLFRILLAFVVCLIVVLLFEPPNPRRVSNLLPLLFLLLLWAFLFWVSPWNFARTQFQKQPAAQGQRTVSFDDNEIKWQWDGGSTVVQWKTYIRWMESKNQILLCSSPIQCGILPKRALNAEQLSELRALLTQKLGTGLRV